MSSFDELWHVFLYAMSEKICNCIYKPHKCNTILVIKVRLIN